MFVLSTWFGCAEPEGDPAAAEVPTSSPFESCNPTEIEQLAAKHGFQLVFEPCGTNSFLDVAWSTDGHQFYFRRGMTHKVIDAADPRRREKNAPTSIPVGSVGWLSATRLALPLGPSPEVMGGPFRLAVWDTATEALVYYDLPAELTDPSDLTRTDNQDRLVFSALREGKRTAFGFDLASQQVSEPFPWLLPFDTLTYSAAGNSVVAGVGETVTLYDATTGKVRGMWAPATRGAMHPGGQWLALEHSGEPVSVFHPVGLEEMSPDDQKVALEKAAARASEQPDDYPRQVRPPTLSFVDAKTAKRYLITAVQGSQFEWYETKDYYASFVSWGVERHQVRRNVMLGDLAKWMLKAEQGVTQLYVHPASPTAPTEAPAP
ncbi:MAG: hypothetical protein ABMA64_32160 [Myxococcota bacterium]